MSNNFKITDSEINQVVLHSPYSLADSPASLGQGASQVKKYFYDFIYTLAKKINLHLEDLASVLDSHRGLITELEKMDTALGGSIVTQLDSHNASELSHADIREKIDTELQRHNQGALSHNDIREKLDALLKKCELACSLASGKMKVYAFDDPLEMLEHLNTNEENRVGDIYLISDPTMPDFTLFEIDAQKRDEDIALDYDDISSGALALEPNKSYYFRGARLISSEGNLETSYLAKKEELDKIEAQLVEFIENATNTIATIQSALLKKENSMEYIENSAPSVVISNGNEYNLGTRTSILIEIEESDVFEAIFNFRTGTTEPSFDAPSELYFVGDDTLDGRLYPIDNRIYEVNIKRVCGVLIARVGAIDYEVIE